MRSVFVESPAQCRQLARAKDMYGDRFYRFVFEENKWCSGGQIKK
jgi:hypothetical protein